MINVTSKNNPMKPEDILIPAIIVALIWSIVLYRIISGANDITIKIQLQNWELLCLMSEKLEVEPENIKKAVNLKEPVTVNTPYENDILCTVDYNN
jgi:hypothetical protein